MKLLPSTLTVVTVKEINSIQVLNNQKVLELILTCFIRLEKSSVIDIGIYDSQIKCFQTALFQKKKRKEKHKQKQKKKKTKKNLHVHFIEKEIFQIVTDLIVVRIEIIIWRIDIEFFISSEIKIKTSIDWNVIVYLKIVHTDLANIVQ